MARKEKKKAPDQAELAALCNHEFQNSQTFMVEIAGERAEALNGYNSEPYGNEEDGLSRYVASDIRDTIEWILPQLVDMFVGGDTPVVFLAENEEDAPAAEIETRYCQYVFERQNKGVILTYSWFKDALIQKNGIVKAYWDEHQKIEREEYKNKTYQEWAALDQDDEFEIDECTITINDIEYSEEEVMDIIGALQSDPEAVQKIEQAAKFHIIGYRTNIAAQAKIENVPPENFFVRKDHNSIYLKDATYCCEVYEKTRSDLIEMGYSEELVKSLPAGQRLLASNEKQARFRKEGGVALAMDTVTGDETRDLIMLYDHYVRSDYDGDGVAELRLVRTVGPSAEHVLENEEVDCIIYHAITPYLNTHKFFGRSVADNLVDLQKAKAQLWRNGFDAVMYSAIPRKKIKGTVNIEDLMSYVPGGLIRMGADGSVENDLVPFTAGDVFPMIDRLDMVRAERSGFSKDTMGLNPDALANSTNMVGMAIMQQSQLLIKMIATIFAASGFEDLMLHIRELVMKNERSEKIFNLTGEFLQTDPRDWRKQRMTQPLVGIGHAGKMEEITVMNSLMATQTAFVTAQGGIDGKLTNAALIYNTIARLCKRMGIKDPSNYFQDPKTYKTPAAPGPSLAEVNLKAGIDKMKFDAKAVTDKHALEITKAAHEHEEKMAKLAQDERLAMAQIESAEYMHDQDLLYKYGKDAHDQGAKSLERLDNILTIANNQPAEDAENDDSEEAADGPITQQPDAGAAGVGSSQ